MFRALKTLMSVPVIMVCAMGGTIGLLKTIEKFTPYGGISKDAVEDDNT